MGHRFTQFLTVQRSVSRYYLLSKLFLFDCLRLLWISGMRALERHRQQRFIHDSPFTNRRNIYARVFGALCTLHSNRQINTKAVLISLVRHLIIARWFCWTISFRIQISALAPLSTRSHPIPTDLIPSHSIGGESFQVIAF